MSAAIKPVKIVIMGKEFVIACPEEEQTSLIKAAEYLDSKMKDVQRNGKVIGVERITVMAALNMAHELLDHKEHGKNYDQSVGSRLFLMQDKIDSALNKVQQVEF